jgi:type IV pilus assembly protein PilZ
MANMPAIFREFMRLERIREADALSIVELERLTQLRRILATHFKPGGNPDHIDKQASLRVPTRLRVSFESYGELRQCLMTNISRGGVFVATQKPLPMGTPFLLRIEIADSDELLELRGEVATVNTGADMQSEEEGMGIRFSNLSEEQQAQVQKLYGQAMSKALEQITD